MSSDFDTKDRLPQAGVDELEGLDLAVGEGILRGLTLKDAILASGQEYTQDIRRYYSQNIKLMLWLEVSTRQYVRGTLKNLAMHRLGAILDQDSPDPQIQNVQIRAIKLTADINHMVAGREKLRKLAKNGPESAADPAELAGEIEETKAQLARLNAHIERNNRVIDITPAPADDDDLLDL